MHRYGVREDSYTKFVIEIVLRKNNLIGELPVIKNHNMILIYLPNLICIYTFSQILTNFIFFSFIFL